MGGYILKNTHTAYGTDNFFLNLVIVAILAAFEMATIHWQKSKEKKK